MSRNNLTESVYRYILLYSWWGNSICKSNLYKSQSPPFTILKWQSNNREQINKAGNLIWRDPKNMDVWGGSLFKRKLQLHKIFWFTIYSLPQSSWHNSHSHASTGIKFYSCPQESYILVYQATIWSWNKLYLRQRDTVHEIMLWKRWSLKSVSSSTKGYAASSPPAPHVASDRLATAIIIHLLLYSIHKDNVIDYSILITKQLLKKNTDLWILGWFYFYSIV